MQCILWIIWYSEDEEPGKVILQVKTDAALYRCEAEVDIETKEIGQLTLLTTKPLLQNLYVNIQSLSN